MVKRNRLGALTAYLYVSIMVVLFAKEAIYYINKYNHKQVIEKSEKFGIKQPHRVSTMQIVNEVSEEERDKALLPPVTICMFLGYNKSMSLLEALQFDSYCDKETEDIKHCFEKLMYSIKLHVQLAEWPAVSTKSFLCGQV